MNTDQLFFKYYGQKELYVIGVTSDYDAAVSVVEQILCEGYAASEEFSPKQIFEKKDFSVSDQLASACRLYRSGDTGKRHPYPYFRNPARPAQKNSCIFPANEKNSGKEGRNEGNSAGRAGGRCYCDNRFFG